MRRLEIRMVPIRIRYIAGGTIGHPVFLQIASRQRADERTRTALLLITSLLAHVLACTGVSGNCGSLEGFRPSGSLTLSSAY
jgi:hypothetical protein